MKNTVQSNIRGMLAVVVAAGLVFVNNSVFAAEEGDITIEGTVLTVSEILVTPEAGHNSLNLTGEASKLVATVNEKNNDPDGYTVTLVSDNASGAQARLKANNQTGNFYVEYSMKYGTAGTSADDDVLLAGGIATVTTTSAPTGINGENKKLTVNIAANSWPDAGVYTDTLTLTIASK